MSERIKISLPEGLEAEVVIEAGRQLAAAASASVGFNLDAERRTAMREVMAGAMEKLVAEALTEPFQPTNEYGSPKGDPVTLRELIMVEARAQLEPSRGTGYNRQKTAFEKFVSETIAAEIRKDMDGVFKQARERVMAAVDAEAVKAFSQTVEKGLRRVTGGL